MLARSNRTCTACPAPWRRGNGSQRFCWPRLPPELSTARCNMSERHLNGGTEERRLVFTSPSRLGTWRARKLDVKIPICCLLSGVTTFTRLYRIRGIFKISKLFCLSRKKTFPSFCVRTKQLVLSVQGSS